MTSSVSLLNRSEGIVSEGIGRAAVLLTHPLRAWAVERAVRQGQVTSRDISREFPAAHRVRVKQHLQDLVTANWLTPITVQALGKSGCVEYAPADIQALHDLHTYLSQLLASEVTHETHE